MSVTANVTRDTGRTSGVTHGPITRSDPIRSDPALLQLLLWSPSHHGVQKVSTREAAPVVAPSPVTTPDAMMSLTAIEHLDFEPEVPCDGSWCGELCQNAAFGVVVALCRGCREGGRSFICRRCWAGCQTAGWLCPSCDRSCEPRFIRLVVTFR